MSEFRKLRYEQLSDNQLPLNQAAKQALKSAREKPDPSNLYLVQLLRWAVENQKVEWELPRSQQSVLLEYLAAFDAWSPDMVMQVFLESDDGDQVNLLEPGPLDPVSLAEEGLNQLHSRLLAAGRYPNQAFRE